MKLKDLLNKLSSIANEKPELFESNVIIQADGPHVYTVDIEEISIVDGQVILEGEW